MFKYLPSFITVEFIVTDEIQGPGKNAGACGLIRKYVSDYSDLRPPLWLF